MKKIAVYPGSFDPPTNGHIDILYRASKIFDRIIIAITDSNTIKKPTFSINERIEILRQITKKSDKIIVDSFSGLLVDYVQKVKANVVIRGLRAVSDFEYEFQMALMNRRLNEKIETVFLMPDEQYTYLSSSLVKEITRLGGNVKGLVPDIVLKKLKSK